MDHNSEPFRSFLRDFGLLIRESALDAKSEYALAKDAEDEDIKLGRLMAFYDILSLMQQQLNAFELTDEAGGLEGFDAERDLL